MWQVGHAIELGWYVINPQTSEYVGTTGIPAKCMSGYFNCEIDARTMADNLNCGWFKNIDTDDYVGVQVDNVRFSLMGDLYSLPIFFERHGMRYVYYSEAFERPGLFVLTKVW